MLSVISKLKFRNHSAYHKFIILLSGDISLNPGPNQTLLSNDIWDPFKKRGLHFLHLNVNSLLPKIDEVKYIAEKSNAAVIGITETKLDDSVRDPEISINRYDIIRNDRNRKGGGVACYICQNICYNSKNVFPSTVEKVFFDIILPKTKPFCVGIFYRPPNQYGFLENINLGFSKLRQETNDIFVMGDMNINIYVNGKTIFENSKNTLSSNTPLSSITSKYKEFCSCFALIQLIEFPTRITKNSSSLIDHILTNAKEKVSNFRIIDTGLSDHQ